MLEQLRGWAEPALRGLWRDAGTLALLATGAAMVWGGASLLRIGFDLEPRGSLGIVALTGGAGLALAIAGICTIFRRRRHLVQRLLGVLTAASWALALTLLSRGNADQTADSLLAWSTACAAFLLVVVVFGEFIAPESDS